MPNASPDTTLLLLGIVLVGLITRYTSMYRAYYREAYSEARVSNDAIRLYSHR